MPYTSPSSRSPISSSASSPSTSRRSSLQVGTSCTVKSDLPRSASYLARHRRTNSVQSSVGSNIKFSKNVNKNDDEPHKRSIRQLPSVTNGYSNDYDASASPFCNSQPYEIRDKDITKTPTSQIGRQDAASLEPLTKFDGEILAVTNNGSLVEDLEGQVQDKRVTPTGSKSHQSNLIGELPIPMDDEESSDDEDEINFVTKPSMVRKKSGELVRPALRPPIARRRPSSMPGTPTFSKAVHFDSHLEHIRHFLQVDRPLAVSAGSSPVPAYESDSEFPFGEEYIREPPYEWELVVSKFPTETPERLAQAVRVERVFLSNDNKILVGSVIVANLAYKKSVVVRFTLDYWKTTSEVEAEYNQDSRQPVHEGYDRFNFNIKLSDLANLDAKTMFFCVKYCVNGIEFWDNNNYTNFQLDFRKKTKAKANTTRWSSSSLPRSNHRSTTPRPKSMPLYFNDYADGFDGSNQYLNFQQVVEDCMGESRFSRSGGPRLKQDLALDTKIKNIGKSSSNAFGNRYDFGASLSAAINASSVPRRDQSSIVVKVSEANLAHFDEPVSPLSDKPKETTIIDSSAGESGRPIEIKRPGLSSQSYSDLLDKYCFFGSAKSSPQLKDGNLKSNKTNTSNQFECLYDFKETTNSYSSTPDEYQRINSNQRMNTSPPSMSSRLVPSMFPAYQNLHDGYPFLETHAATAIRGQ